ncbi:MAG TPA: thioredoxin domain-containing protein [Syntrophales bacterium]|nr:thioredoxin domain-containing protein [Syntrophales bacterium]HOL58303.1 thioredoxin domain-containing protein [Syntrophales bacterium]HPO34472.1 thioredoxin domain-containing protein [Syntrophales bacterium]
MERKTKIKVVVISLGVVILAALGVGIYFKFFDDSWIVKIDGEKVSTASFLERISRMDPEAHEFLKAQPRTFVEGFVAHLLLLREAQKAAGTKVKDVAEEGVLINSYLLKKYEHLPPVTEKEIDEFYNENRDRFGGKAKAEVGPYIKFMLEQRRLYGQVEKLMEELRNTSKVEINERALAKVAQTPVVKRQGGKELSQALQGNKPVLAEFGADNCAPCRELKPILQKIKTEYAGKMEVIMIDVRYEKEVADRYKIMVVPTLIFFDRTGKEVGRFHGFLSEDKLKERIAQLGIEAGKSVSAP